MRIFDYMQSSEEDKRKWLASFQITTGLKYFGGKSVIGKYLMNHICNMAVQMVLDGKKEEDTDIKQGINTENKVYTGPHIFIDAFTGGGKLGLSIPEGWFDTIVMNDLNYGVYSYFKSCKENPKALVRMIEFIGEHMNKDMYNFIAFNRANNGTKEGSNLAEAEEYIKLYNELEQFGTESEKNEHLEKILYNELAEEIKEAKGLSREQGESSESKEELHSKLELIVKNKLVETKKKMRIAVLNEGLITDEKVEEIVAGAMTYWVTQLDFLGKTDPYKVNYVGETEDNKKGLAGNEGEKEKIERAIKNAKKQIPKISKRMNDNNIIIENLDYRELIKKYNGLSYKDPTQKETDEPHAAIESLASKSKLWYFDPPYHPATLYAGNEAPYEDKFTWGMCEEMVRILHNDEMETYGELKYFIKSDYDPKYTYEQFTNALEITKGKLERLKKEHLEQWQSNQLTWFDKIFSNLEVDSISDNELMDTEGIGDIKERINTLLRYASRMKQQLDYSKLAYHDFDILEENIDITDAEGNIRPKKNEGEIIYYKYLVGIFEKGVKDTETGEAMKGREFIWCRGNYMGKQ